MIRAYVHLPIRCPNSVAADIALNLLRYNLEPCLPLRPPDPDTKLPTFFDPQLHVINAPLLQYCGNEPLLAVFDVGLADPTFRRQWQWKVGNDWFSLETAHQNEIEWFWRQVVYSCVARHISAPWVLFDATRPLPTNQHKRVLTILATIADVITVRVMVNSPDTLAPWLPLAQNVDFVVMRNEQMNSTIDAIARHSSYYWLASHKPTTGLSHTILECGARGYLQLYDPETKILRVWPSFALTEHGHILVENLRQIDDIVQERWNRVLAALRVP